MSYSVQIEEYMEYLEDKESRYTELISYLELGLDQCKGCKDLDGYAEDIKDMVERLEEERKEVEKAIERWREEGY